MKTSVIGYPRIGDMRQLKFAVEKYFKGSISEEELSSVAAEIRRAQWEKQRLCGIDYIPSGDFSLYDGVLDAAALLGIVPVRYKELDISPTDRFFAMARGYQRGGADVKALAMKKWFNTNYHYIVPELDDGAKIELTGTKPFDEYDEALRFGIKTKPVILGAYTLLKLTRYTGARCAEDCVADVAKAYGEILSRFYDMGAEWVQFDEPALVRDTDESDRELFLRLYGRILSGKRPKVLLQTYFGDIRDCYQTVTAMPFEGLGLDFVEGKRTAELVLKYGFPKDKTLFIGAVNGKNIWRNDYARTAALVESVRSHCGGIVLGTSCSLLHVPYSFKGEGRLGEDRRAHFAGAEEKLEELAALSSICDGGADCEAYRENAALFAGRRDCEDKAVKKRVKAIKEEDFIRLPAFSEREKAQKKAFALPLLPTTTIGSFPQTAEVKQNRSRLRKGLISEEEYKAFNKKCIADCIALQEKLGFDVLVHGEYERNDMVEYFGENLAGFLFTEYAWVQSYGTRCVKPPIIWGDVSRKKAMTVEWSVYAQSLTAKPVKGMLTGPVTILNWSFPREDITLKESALQIALAIRDEVLDLESSGIRVIQVDEAALREKLPLRKSDWYSEYLDWAIPAFRLVHSGVRAETQMHTHMCYSEFTDIIPAIDDMDADVITFEASRSDLQILKSLRENNFKTEVGPGVYDIHSPRVPSVEEIKGALRKMLAYVPAEKLWVNPDCGLKTRGVPETEASLENLVAAARQVAEEL